MGARRRLKARDWLNIIVILLLLGLFIWIAREYSRAFGHIWGGSLLESAQNLRSFVLSYGRWGLLTMICLHMLHVIVSVIPSVLVQFVGGLIYGMGLGMLSGFVGIALGSAVSFYLARLLGRRVVALFVSEKSLSKLDRLAGSDKALLVLLLLFILPVPKDFIAYVAGLSNMRAGSFFFVSLTGRLPGMLIATYLGSHLLERNYLLLGLGVALCAAAALLSYIFRAKILALAHKTPKGA